MGFLFPSFFDKPTGFAFAEQEQNEQIELLLRRHWVTNIGWIALAILLFTAPFLLIVLDKMLGLNIVSQVAIKIIVGMLILWYMFTLAYIIEQFLSWYFNIYIVTNQHLIDVNFHSLLSKEILEAGIENVESASSKMSGLSSSIFNFGDVVVQTAAESHQITFDAVPRPDAVADRINDLRALRGGHI